MLDCLYCSYSYSYSCGGSVQRWMEAKGNTLCFGFFQLRFQFYRHETLDLIDES
jgi:hypothetical protein